MFRSLSLPPYETLKKFEGKGNWAIDKYYKFPHRVFYRKKLKLIDSMMDKKYGNILDFGSGPGIFTKQLKKHANVVRSYDLGDVWDNRWKFDLIVCASVLEFVPLYMTLNNLKKVMKKDMIVSSPMDTALTRKYFKDIKDKNKRHTHQEIMEALRENFKVEKYKEWMGIYFCVKVSK